MQTPIITSDNEVEMCLCPREDLSGVLAQLHNSQIAMTVGDSGSALAAINKATAQLSALLFNSADNIQMTIEDKHE